MAISKQALERIRRRDQLKPFYVWHRRIGALAALFVVLLAVTGLALNHTEALRLDSRFVGAAWLLDWYGIEEPARVAAYKTQDNWVSLVGDRLYLDQTAVDGHFSDLQGAAMVDELLVVIADGDALVLTPDGQLVERLGRHNGVPAGIEAVGSSSGEALVVKASHGLYAVDNTLSNWRSGEINGNDVSWAQQAVIPAALADSLKRDFRENILPAERVMLDLHSGRIFGIHGPLLMDAAALVFLVLALTGFWMWLRRPRDRIRKG